jgi:hypothetical protein
MQLTNKQHSQICPVILIILPMMPKAPNSPPKLVNSHELHTPRNIHIWKFVILGLCWTKQTNLPSWKKNFYWTIKSLTFGNLYWEKSSHEVHGKKLELPKMKWKALSCGKVPTSSPNYCNWLQYKGHRYYKGYSLRH